MRVVCTVLRPLPGSPKTGTRNKTYNPIVAHTRKGWTLCVFGFSSGLHLSAFLASCSGGGGSSQGPLPAPAGGGAPAPQSVINTSNPYYLPLSPGNTWKFNDGVTFIDQGTVTNMPCDPGDPYEQVAVYTGGQTATPAWSFYFIPGGSIGSPGAITGIIRQRLLQYRGAMQAPTAIKIRATRAGLRCRATAQRSAIHLRAVRACRPDALAELRRQRQSPP